MRSTSYKIKISESNRWRCAYCGKRFHTCISMQKHIIRETCLPNNKADRMIIKFITLETRNDPSFERSIDKYLESLTEEDLE